MTDFNRSLNELIPAESLCSPDDIERLEGEYRANDYPRCVYDLIATVKSLRLCIKTHIGDSTEKVAQHFAASDTSDGLREDVRQLIRVALTNPADMRGFIQANYPKEYAEMGQNAATDTGLVERLAAALQAAFSACELHNGEYHHITKEDTLAEWRQLIGDAHAHLDAIENAPEVVTDAQMDAEDNDPVDDAYARGYADGYKAKADAVENAPTESVIKQAYIALLRLPLTDGFRLLHPDVYALLRASVAYEEGRSDNDVQNECEAKAARLGETNTTEAPRNKPCHVCGKMRWEEGAWHCGMGHRVPVRESGRDIIRWEPIPDDLPVGRYWIPSEGFPGERIVGELHHGTLDVQKNYKFWRCNVTKQQVWPTQYAPIADADQGARQ